MVKTSYLLICIQLFTLSFSFAQEQDEECIAPDKKVLKILDKAKTTPAPEKYKLFQEAQDAAPTNAMVFFEYAMVSYDAAETAYNSSYDPTQGERLMSKTKALFEKVLSLCPDYHADTYYYLGAIEYENGNKEKALQYFKKFMNFESQDDFRIPSDFAEKRDVVKKVLDANKKASDFLSEEVPYDPKMVKNVSSPKDEFFPMISPDNELMFFTRRLDRRNLGDLQSNVVEEFTVAHRGNATSDFDEGKPLPSPFNNGTFLNYGASTVSVDNKELIICACKYEQVQGQNYKNCDLYISHFQRSGEGGNDYTWTPLENMGDNINTNDGWESQPSLSADGNILFYTAVRPTTTNQKDDIFMSRRNSDGTWGLAVPFDEINTPGKDKSPFLHQDSETLYFVSEVSDSRYGVGGLDIFYIKMNPDGTWSKPKNIGFPINSKEDEIGIFVSTDGKQAYFSSRVGGDWNIYSFDLYEEARPKSVVLVKGELKDSTGAPVQDASIEIAYANSDKIETVRVNGNDGKYAVILHSDTPQDVMVSIKKEGQAFESKLIKKEELTASTYIKGEDMQVHEIKVGVPYTINDILYTTASAELSDHSKFILREFARFLKNNSTIKVSIQGHTDDMGNDDTNMKLSENRAIGVKNYLISLGIDKDRLKSSGFGETQPRVANDNEANRAKNRRTDFVIDAL
jgi:outer membrane protein OmpA-like peptidoglycan-associated protein/tetratricopeptide (TPR) repeat protein